jgi:uncharacterized protein YbjT (DUF2867 family)
LFNARFAFIFQRVTRTMNSDEEQARRDPMILVLGATGVTGGEVARQLIQAGQRPRLLVRNPAKAGAFEGKADIVQGDLDRPESLRAAMTGIERLYLVSAAAHNIELEGNAVEAAKTAGVKHIVKLSVVGADAPETHDQFSKWHAQAEARLRSSGLAWTMLRPHFFMTNALQWGETIRAQGAFYQPTGEGRFAAIDPADIGACAVKALTEPGHEGKAYELSGPESLSAAQYAAKISSVIGKPVRFVDIPADGMRQGLVKASLPPVLVDALLDLMATIKSGKLDVVTDAVAKVTGRKARSFDDWALRHIAAFR